jgi:hypothetical protein
MKAVPLLAPEGGVKFADGGVRLLQAVMAKSGRRVAKRRANRMSGIPEGASQMSRCPLASLLLTRKAEPGLQRTS